MKPSFELLCRILLYNFKAKDIVEHGEEILQQLQYEIKCNNVKIIVEED